jgi:hypothetical protein
MESTWRGKCKRAQAATLTAAQVRPCTPVRQRAMLVELSTARATGRAGSLLSQRVRAFCGARGFTGVGPVFKRAHVRVLLHVPRCLRVCSTKSTFDNVLFHWDSSAFMRTEASKLVLGWAS